MHVARRWWRRAVGAALALGCGLAPRVVVAQGSPPPTPFRPGELALYSVEFSGIGIGSGSIRVDSGETISGAPTWLLRFAVRGGLPFFRINDVMQSWYDPAGHFSRRFTQELQEGSKRYSRHFDFYPERLELDERGKGRAPSVAAPLDDASFLFFIRTQRLDVGTTYEWGRYFKPETNPVRLAVLRRERIRVPAGTFDAIVVQPLFKSRGIFSEGGRAEVWLADDSTRRVLQLRSKLSFGSLNLYLTKYTSGR